VGEVIASVRIPVIAVLGNHDYESDATDLLEQALRNAGAHVLEGEALRLEIAGQRVGIAGTKGFGGGFQGACGSAFGEPEMKVFMSAAERAASGLRNALRELDRETLDYRLVVLHYAPVQATLVGERLEIYPFLGSQMLEDVIDGARVDLAVHGHAHAGSESGRTARGTPVRNVAYPLVREPYRVFVLPGAERVPIHPPAAVPYLPGAPHP
jgi:Icc-related predicted phosphoesterase